MPKVVIGCRLPHGLILTHPLSKQKVTLDGYHKSKIVARDGSPAATFVTTEVDQEFWDTWKTAYSGYAPLKSGAIFEARNETEAVSKAKELRKEKTGFEPLEQSAIGVKPADKK